MSERSTTHGRLRAAGSHGRAAGTREAVPESSAPPRVCLGRQPAVVPPSARRCAAARSADVLITPARLPCSETSRRGHWPCVRLDATVMEHFAGPSATALQQTTIHQLPTTIVSKLTATDWIWRDGEFIRWDDA